MKTPRFQAAATSIWLLIAVLPFSAGAQTPTPTPFPSDANFGALEVVATFNKMPAGVSVSASGRVFVSFPRIGTDSVGKSVVEVVNGRGVAYPNHQVNTLDVTQPSTCFISAQSVVVDARETLWVLDSGILGPSTTPIAGGAKLVAIDLSTNQITRTIVFAQDLIGTGSALADVRFDLTRGSLGFAYITDNSPVGPGGIIVVDLSTGTAVRRLAGDPSVTADRGFRAVVEGQQFVVQPTASSPVAPVTNGADGIALSADGKTLYYCSLGSRRISGVNADVLSDFTQSDAAVAATVRGLGEKGLARGLETDNQGRLYLTNPEYDAVRRFVPEAGASGMFNGSFETIAHNRHLVWPDTLSLGSDGSLYITSSQFDRLPQFKAGQDLRQKPFYLFKIQTDGTPARR